MRHKMQLRWKILVLVSLLELALLVAASPAPAPHGDHGHQHHNDDAPVLDVPLSPIQPQQASSGHGGHSHMHAGAPKTVLNETAILLDKGPSPLSYLELDSGIGAELFDKYGSHYGTMVAHGLYMTLAFAIALPLLIFFRIAKHTFLAGLSQVVFQISLVLGMLTGLSYSASTPNLYHGQKHGSIGWIISFLAFGLSSTQILRAAIILFSKSQQDVPFIVRVKHLLTSNTHHERDSAEYELVAQETNYEDAEVNESRPTFEQQDPPLTGVTLVHDEEEDLQRKAIQGFSDRSHDQQSHQQQRSLDMLQSPSERSSGNTAGPQYWRRPHQHETSLDVSRRPSSTLHGILYRNDSRGTSGSARTHSTDETLHDEHLAMSPGSISPPLTHGPQEYGMRGAGEPERPFSNLKEPSSRAAVMRGILKYGEIFLWRSMILLGWTAFITGCITYWGGCRSPYVNACLAHEIKGSIFFWYGILTFGRYCGAWAELGWAWNKKPNTTGTWREHWPSAEMVESFVIWLYGATNTWMERFGVEPGSPFSLHQVQHISIAVMFFFTGSAGMLLESKTCRNWISGAILARNGSERGPAPASYSSSFNIFPALTIGITGLAMSAHHQEYQFSVSIHALWGTLLAGFAVCRILTYTFLHLRPPASILPSRPPTEALAAFCLCAGGIVFMLSTEEVIFWAMRHEFDDLMTFLNVTVAFVCGVIAWIVVLMAVKGWATRRTDPAPRSRDADMQARITRKLGGAV